MIIDTYESQSAPGKYLGVPHGTQMGSWTYPDDIDPDFLSVRQHKTGVDVGPGSTVIGLDPAKVREQITERGWAVVRTGRTSA